MARPLGDLGLQLATGQPAFGVGIYRFGDPSSRLHDQNLFQVVQRIDMNVFANLSAALVLSIDVHYFQPSRVLQPEPLSVLPKYRWSSGSRLPIVQPPTASVQRPQTPHT